MAIWNQSRWGWRGDAGIDHDRAQLGTAVGEHGQFGLLHLADLREAAPDQLLDLGVGPGDGGFDVAKADSRCRWPASQLRM